MLSHEVIELLVASVFTHPWTDLFIDLGIYNLLGFFQAVYIYIYTL